MSNTYQFNTKLLDIIVCPKTKEKLTYDEGRGCLISENSKIQYEIKHGIPILIIN